MTPTHAEIIDAACKRLWPKRKDLRGCKGCHKKLLAAGKAAMRPVNKERTAYRAGSKTGGESPLLEGRK